MSQISQGPSLQIANHAHGISHVFIRDLELDAHIGVYRVEKLGVQPVRINVDLTVQEAGVPVDDRLSNVVDYGHVVEGIRSIIAEGHVNLLETLAERVAAFALQDRRVLVARVRIEKLKVIPEARSVGIEIERSQQAR